MEVVASSLMRGVRLYRLDRNPLRRTSDRLESLVVALALGLALLSLWPAAALGATIYQSGTRAERDTAPGVRGPVPVTLVELPGGGRTWVTATGDPVTGAGVLLFQAPVGATARVWIDRANAVITPPPGHAETVMAAIVVAALTLTGALVVLCGGYLCARRVLDRNRLGQWEAEWIRADEQWPRPPQRG